MTTTGAAPPPLDGPLNTALSLYGSGRFAEALDLLENLLAAEPENVVALNLAAVCSLRAGNPSEAENYWIAALRAKPDYAEAHNNLGLLLQEQRRFTEAEESYRRALSLRPGYADADYNLGNLLQEQKRFVEAEAHYRRALSLRPDYPHAHNNLGNLLQEQKRSREAEESYRRAFSIQPDHSEARNNLGNLLRDLDRPDEAEEAYREALSLHPDYAAHHNLGLLLREQRRFAEAEEQYRSAIALRPDQAAAYYSLGVVLREQNRLAEAEEACRSAIRFHPENADSLYNLGVLLQERERFVEAEESYRRALSLRPDYAAAHNNLAVLLQARKCFAEAGEAYGRAISLQPDYPEAHNNLGVLLQEQKRFEEAEEAYRSSVSLRPDYAEAHYNLGNLLQGQKRFAEAEEAYRRTLSLQPGYPEAHNNLGLLLKEQRRFAEAEEAYRRAISLQPGYAEAHNNHGNLFLEQNRPDEAEEAYRRAISLRPGYAEAHYNLGNLLQGQKRFAEAEAHYRRALALRPDYAIALCNLVHILQHMCRWTGLESEAALLLESVGTNRDGGVAPFPLLSIPESTPMQQRECARHFAEHCSGAYLLRPPLHETASRADSGRLRLGYLSSDFQSHAVSFLLAEVVELHDRKRFETIGYSCGPDDGTAFSRRIRGAFDRFRDIRTFPSEAAARRIVEDSVDILVDLNGHTRRGRPRIFALRPAPVQVNWLGYPGTMGAERIADYIIGDPVVTPLAHAAFYSETLALMPHCYQPNDRQRRIGPPTTREAHGLPEEGFVFCSFNQGYKIAPNIFDLWGRLLAAVPGSVLWLLECNSDAARENLRSEAALRGIAPERIVFAPKLPPAEHLGRLRLADLMLDTFPYTSHTTGSDALWVGLPLVTRLGETFASRVAGSLLRAAELPELVTATFDGYFNLALGLAEHPMKLAAVKDRLAARRLVCPLFDSARFTRDLERLFERMWENHLAGRKERIVLADEPSDGRKQQ